MKVVSFDYFPLTDMIDFGFTETEHWSENFAWLDYESINFMESMGSISLWIWIGLIFALAVLILYISKVNLRSNMVKSFFLPMSLAHISIRFMQATLYEIMISASIGVRIFKLHEYWNTADKVCVGFQLLVSSMAIMFICFVLYFTIFKIRKIQVLAVSSLINKYEKAINSAELNFKERYKKNHLIVVENSNLRQSLAQKENLAASAFANSIIRHKRKINNAIKVKSNELSKD